MKNSLLIEPKWYQRQIELLHSKYLFTPKLFDLQHDGVTFASISMNSAIVAKLIAKSLEQSQYHIEIGNMRRIRTQGGRKRDVFSFHITDLIVSRAISSLNEDAMSHKLSPQLYPYRTGLSWLTPASDFAAYIRAHVKSRPNLRERGLFVLRRDVEAYSDTLPVRKNSRVWQMIRSTLEGSAKRTITPYEWGLIEKVVRPEVAGETGVPFSLIRGIPTGQPIGPVLYNLYTRGVGS